ncbi:cryptococcal mannosyltransferase 1-domain-containing protein [Irpex lacteus]|nr:cryptococcal mannosyltransferase 1-domain-containing protein [Irpex lacteus]
MEKFAGVWQPAFPKIWTTWVVILVVLPVFALLQLFWLLGHSLVIWLREKQNTSKCAYEDKNERCASSVEEGREEHALLSPGNTDEEQRSTRQAPSHSTRRASSRVSSSGWVIRWAQILAYSIIVTLGYRAWVHYENHEDIRWRPVLKTALAQHPRNRAGYAKGEKIFIAANFYNNHEVLPYWTATLMDVIAYLGPDNVAVSIVESNSDDQTPELLLHLDDRLAELNVKRRILIQDKAIPKPPNMEWNNRIEFLAALRNRALEPLIQEGGYDKVLFSNDVYVEPESLLELIETADGNYDMACAMDFGHFGAYDMWVLRDRIGKLTYGIWPFFSDVQDYTAIKSALPVPVYTCWNGVVVFQADPILPVHLRSNRTLSTSPLKFPPPPTHPLANSTAESPALTPPLRFRASPRGEGCFSSESFLLPYDMRRLMGMDRIYVNPRVRVGYVWHFYWWHKWVLRHPYVVWFVEKIYDGAWMQYTKMVVGDGGVYTWDGGDCHPWWYGDWW